MAIGRNICRAIRALCDHQRLVLAPSENARVNLVRPLVGDEPAVSYCRIDPNPDIACSTVEARRVKTALVQ
jgi:hypothetical protein